MNLNESLILHDEMTIGHRHLKVLVLVLDLLVLSLLVPNLLVLGLFAVDYFGSFLLASFFQLANGYLRFNSPILFIQIHFLTDPTVTV